MIVTDVAPLGFRWSWVPSREVPSRGRWELVDPQDARPCRFVAGPNRRSCKRPSVARLDRRIGTRTYREQAGPNWWHYCERHLYGQRIYDGQLETQVLTEVPE